MKFNYYAFKAIYLHEMDRFRRTLGQSLLSPVIITRPVVSIIPSHSRVIPWSLHGNFSSSRGPDPDHTGGCGQDLGRILTTRGVVVRIYTIQIQYNTVQCDTTQYNTMHSENLTKL